MNHVVHIFIRNGEDVKKKRRSEDNYRIILGRLYIKSQDYMDGNKATKWTCDKKEKRKTRRPDIQPTYTTRVYSRTKRKKNMSIEHLA